MMLEEERQKMNAVLEMLRQDLATVEAGRATPTMIEKIRVDAYNTQMSLLELATITAPEPLQLLVTPFDKTIIKNIAQALSQDRNLGLSVLVDEDAVRVKIPPLTEERRQELVKILGQKLEAARVMIRQIRRDQMVDFKRAREANEIHEDQHRALSDDLQKLTDEMIEKVESMGKTKEQELTTI